MLELRSVTKTFHTPAGPFTAISNLSLTLAPASFVAIVGRSGSGKSTLVNLLAGIDRPSAGEVLVGGTAVHALGEDALAAWRGRHVGVVFQSFQLLPTLTVLENVLLPMDFCGTFPGAKAEARAGELLDRMGIADQRHKFPAALSGGQQQRAAVARALANDPPVVLADEPTGNLDSQTADAMLTLFAGLAREGKTVVLVTHERDVRRRVDRLVTLADGVVASDEHILAEVRHA